MDRFASEDLQALLQKHPAPCLSLYAPTHRGGAEQDAIRWRKHLTEAEKKLVGVGLRAPEARAFVEPARRLLDDPSFWKEQSDGLAFFLAEGFHRSYRLPLAAPDLVVAGKDFHIKPLLPVLSEDAPFFVLALSHNSVRLLQCTRHRGSVVDLPNVPASLAEAMRTHDSDAFLQFHGRSGGEGAGGAQPVFYSRGGDIDRDKEEMLRFFQRIDRGLQPLLKAQSAPLVLAAVDYLYAIYRKANTYEFLYAQGIEGNPDRWSERDLRERAWTLVQPSFQESLRRALARYRQLAGTGETTHELADIVATAVEGHVEVLLIARDRECWGRYDPQTRFLESHEPPRPGDEDLLNRAAIHTLRHGGTVHTVAAPDMPEDVAAAAILRQPSANWGEQRR
ncbi:MAG TPA: hypothetical protein VH643_19080 [Gemmataceae bacterium]